MRRGVKIAVVAVAAFGAVLIAQFPARWAAWLFTGRATTCLRISGTLWNGACAGLAESGSPIGDLTWQLHPLRLLMGSLSADVTLSRGSGTAGARIDAAPNGTITARDLHGAFPLDRVLFPELPPATQGSAEADIPFLRLKGSRLIAIRGRIDVHGLSTRGEPIGDFRLIFPASSSSAEPIGRLTDLGGPLSVDGTIRLTPEPGYVVDALIAARPGAPPDLVNAMRYLGSPDASGRRPFSLSGTF
ncbi:MAG TPA: type II secretion system protein N [Steroidobacteraceae bacterium]